jgi:hypothetical protein
MTKRQPLRAFKVYRKGYILEVKIHKIPTSKKNPHGYRFRCFMVDALSGEEVVGYDNHWPKGSHRHFAGNEEPYSFEDIETLLHDFKRDCETILEEAGDNESS